MSFFNKLISGADAQLLSAGERMEAEVNSMQTAQVQEKEKPRFKRPGDSDAIPYINNTRDNLTKIVDRYHIEATALDADIARLTEERRQLRCSITALEMAIETIGSQEPEIVIDL